MIEQANAKSTRGVAAPLVTTDARCYRLLPEVPHHARVRLVRSQSAGAPDIPLGEGPGAAHRDRRSRWAAPGPSPRGISGAPADWDRTSRTRAWWGTSGRRR